MKTIGEQTSLFVKIDFALIRALILKRKLKLYWVADQVGLSRFTIQRWVNGQVQKVRKDRLQSVAEILGVDADDLLLRNPDTEKHETAHLIASNNLAEILLKNDCLDLFIAIASTLDLSLATKLDRFEILYQLSSALVNRAKYLEASSVGYEALRLAHEIKSPARIIKAIGILMLVHSTRDEFEEAFALSRKLEKYADKVSVEQLWVEKLRSLQIFAMAGMYREAIEFHADHGLRLEEILENKRPLAICFYTLGNCHFNVKEYRKAEANYEKGLKFALQCGFSAISNDCEIGIIRAQIALKQKLPPATIRAISSLYSAHGQRSLNYHLLMSDLACLKRNKAKALGILNHAEIVFQESKSIQRFLALEKARIAQLDRSGSAQR